MVKKSEKSKIRLECHNCFEKFGKDQKGWENCSMEGNNECRWVDNDMADQAYGEFLEHQRKCSNICTDEKPCKEWLGEGISLFQE